MKAHFSLCIFNNALYCIFSYSYCISPPSHSTQSQSNLFPKHSIPKPPPHSRTIHSSFILVSIYQTDCKMLLTQNHPLRPLPHFIENGWGRLTKHCACMKTQWGGWGWALELLMMKMRKEVRIFISSSDGKWMSFSISKYF